MFLVGWVGVKGAEFPIVSSSSSMLEEPVWVSEEPKEYNGKQSQDIFLRLPE